MNDLTVTTLLYEFPELVSNSLMISIIGLKWIQRIQILKQYMSSTLKSKNRKLKIKKGMTASWLLHV